MQNTTYMCRHKSEKRKEDVREQYTSQHFYTVASIEELLVLYAVPGSVWPTNSLLDKFRRFSHLNETHYSCPAGYRNKPKSFASSMLP